MQVVMYQDILDASKELSIPLKVRTNYKFWILKNKTSADSPDGDEATEYSDSRGTIHLSNSKFIKLYQDIKNRQNSKAEYSLNITTNENYKTVSTDKAFIKSITGKDDKDTDKSHTVIITKQNDASADTVRAFSNPPLSFSISAGSIATQNLVNYLDSEAGRKAISTLRLHNINPEGSYTEGGPLSGLTFVLTGSLSMDRPTFSRRIIAAGGKVASSVTSSTSYLLAGTGGGSKRTKAEKLGIPIISEADIEQMMHGSEQPAEAAAEELFTLES